MGGGQLWIGHGLPEAAHPLLHPLLAEAADELTGKVDLRDVLHAATDLRAAQCECLDYPSASTQSTPVRVLRVPQRRTARGYGPACRVVQCVQFATAAPLVPPVQHRVLGQCGTGTARLSAEPLPWP